MRTWISILLFVVTVACARAESYQWISKEGTADISRKLLALSYPCAQRTVLDAIPLKEPLRSLPWLGKTDHQGQVLKIWLTDPLFVNEYYILLIHFRGDENRYCYPGLSHSHHRFYLGNNGADQEEKINL